MGGRVRVAKPAVTHVAFSHPGQLCVALQMYGRLERAIWLLDDLSTGPIASLDRSARATWRREVLGVPEGPAPGTWEYRDTDGFWTEIAKLRGAVIAWTSRYDLREVCGLHALLSQLDASVPVSIVDVSERGLAAFQWANPAMIVDRDLISRAVPLSPVARAGYRARWQRLRAENASVRVLVSPDVPQSVPISYYDDTIARCATVEWRRSAALVGDTLNTWRPGELRQTYDTGLLFSRVLRLVDDRVLEGRSDVQPWTMRDSQVRRRPS